MLNASYKVGMSAAEFCRFSFLKEEEVKGRDSGTNVLLHHKYQFLWVLDFSGRR